MRNTDKVLLEKAARAAGIELEPIEIRSVTAPGDDRFIGYRTLPGHWPRGWFNPLNYDGDALRLAVALSFSVIIDTEIGAVSINDKDDVCIWIEDETTDMQEATRRAIVRAAAEIGKAL